MGTGRQRAGCGHPAGDAGVLPPGLPGPPTYPVRLTYRTDRLDPENHTGWTVIVTGPAEQITDTDHQMRYRLPMRAWPDEHTEHLLRLRPETITGYRLTRATS
ncbi:pyridoxamine 5'-phosphate oxidase family protein [Kitasatospora sp. MAP5-34]|uniref:pyridoxamine 5'-phosphate oxidase family protein n=1 Tax=Kitasatospora sp. MAP5-34 TaxID=3035102 RepID=UPI00247660C5|nr:pyridoxamine 5'-phosphate oxidase family protein [Kitasatospora sp. MAP5-34]MDH6575970.1 hypothetical protein [Kitasatospora sp. MAP5-34]